MKSPEKTKNRQKKIERNKRKRKEIAKLIKTNKHKGKSITDVDCEATRAIKNVYEKTLNILN